MKQFKKVMSILVASMMTFSLAGCGAQPKETATQETTNQTSSDQVTIKFSWWGGDGRHEATTKAVNAFMAQNPDIKVETQYSAWSGWEDSMSAAFATGTAPDVNQINWNWITSFSADGKAFKDINEYSNIIDLSQFKDSALELCTVADKLQAVPVAMTGRIFYWNKTMFEQAGISVPTSLKELMEAGEIFKDKLGDDYYPLVLAEYDRMMLMVYYLESVYGKDWVNDNTLNYTQEEVEKGLEFIQSLEKAHVIPTIQTILGDGAESLDKNPKWMEGKYAGIFEWDSAASKFAGALNEGQEFVVGNYFEDMGEYHGGFAKVSLGFAISETTKYPEACAKLIEFLLNSEEGIELMGSQRGIPLSSKGLSVCEEKGLLDATVSEANKKVLDWVAFDLDPKFEAAELKSSDGVYYDVMAGLSYGDYDTKEAASTLIEGIQEILAR